MADARMLKPWRDILLIIPLMIFASLIVTTEPVQWARLPWGNFRHDYVKSQVDGNTDMLTKKTTSVIVFDKPVGFMYSALPANVRILGTPNLDRPLDKSAVLREVDHIISKSSDVYVLAKDRRETARINSLLRPLGLHRTSQPCLKITNEYINIEPTLNPGLCQLTKY
jgi:hypothetical protein